MKKILLLICLSMLLNAETLASKGSPEDVLLKVNGMPITRIDIVRQVNALVPSTYYHASVSDEKLQSLESKAKEQLIERKLLYLYGKKIGITAPDDELEKLQNKAIDAFKSEEKFKEALKKAHFTPKEFRKGLEEEIIVKEVIKRKVKVDFTEDELRAYYKKNKHKFKEPEKIKVSLIYVKNDPSDPKGQENAKKKAEKAYEKINKGEAFADVAAEYSEDMYRIKGGDMGYIHKGRFDEDIDTVAFSLNAGEVSHIMENTLGFFIIKVEDKKKPNQLPFDQVKFGLKSELIEKTEKERKDQLLARLKKKAEIIEQ